MDFAQRIERKLTETFEIVRLDLHDVSHKHRGHAGYRAGGETHFRLLVVSHRFAGVSRVERQRLVHAALAAELQERVHALQLTCRTPEEDARVSG
jgi:BolA protein